MTERVKLAYLTYDDMLLRLESGEINEYDIIFSKDKLTAYIITQDLKPVELKSRVYVFDSIEDAEKALNESSDTYNGQIVSILCNDIYRGYIVNEKNGNYIVIPLWDFAESIDYNTLGNQPIYNLIGTLSEPIMVENLDDGIYKIKGQYQISNLVETIHLSVSDTIITVRRNEECILVKEITSYNITDYIITDSTVSSNVYITKQFLEENGYATNDSVDAKISALELSITADMKTYVQDIVNKVFDEELDKRIDDCIDEKIQYVDNSQIDDLF